MKLARGRSNLMTMVCLSGVSVPVTQLTMVRAWATLSFGSRTRVKVNFTSSAVNSAPEWNLTP